MESGIIALIQIVTQCYDSPLTGKAVSWNRLLEAVLRLGGPCGSVNEDLTQKGGGSGKGCPHSLSLRRGTSGCSDQPRALCRATLRAGRTASQGFQEGQEGALDPAAPRGSHSTCASLWLEEVGLTPRSRALRFYREQRPPPAAPLFPPGAFTPPPRPP